MEFAFSGTTLPGLKKKKPKPDLTPLPTNAAGNSPQTPLTLASGGLDAGGVSGSDQQTPPQSVGPSGPLNTNGVDPQADLDQQAGGTEDVDQFAGMGPWLEEDDTTVYNRANDLVLRQELLAQNRLAQDTYFTRIKLGYPWQTLEKDPNRDTYKVTLPAGSKSLTIAPVPNQAWDLVNKATEAIMADPPQPDPAPLNDSEQARSAADMADRFLTEDAGEAGTNDTQVFYNAIDGSLTCATKYIELWTDPQGGGYVPLTILAHPQAQSPENPLVGPDGMPTPDPIERYVTAPEGGQFTNDPSQAAPQWLPKIRASVWGREHWRTYPETATTDNARMMIGLLYCTLAEAKRRWPTVAQMSQAELNALLDWTPTRYLVLLPPYLRARWKILTGSDLVKGGSSDERILFYYQVLCKADAEHPHGADVVVTGAMQGKVLDKRVLAATVPMEQEPNDQGIATPEGNEVRCMDIRVVQVTPRADPDERDPTGRAYMQLFSGATEADAALRSGFLEALDIWLHPDSYTRSVSAVSGDQVLESRASGTSIPILTKDDMPQYGNQPPIPPTFWDAVDHNQQAIRSIASLDKAVTGEEDPTKESGKALQLAIGRAMVGLQRMNYPVNAARERYWRIKLQLAMRDYTTPHLIRYVGDDGSYKVEEFTGVNFALVGNVGVQSGTGTMMPAEQKVQYLNNVSQAGFLPREEAADAARQTFAQRLGLPDDPHTQHVERCVTLWLKGMPEGFQAQWQQYLQQRQAFNAAKVQALSNAAPGSELPPPMPEPKPQWTPFPERPNDKEVQMAAKWARRLSRVMSTVKYSQMPVEWRQVLDEKYEQSMQIVSAAAQPAPEPNGKPEPPK